MQFPVNRVKLSIQKQCRNFNSVESNWIFHFQRFFLQKAKKSLSFYWDFIFWISKKTIQRSQTWNIIRKKYELSWRRNEQHDRELRKHFDSLLFDKKKVCCSSQEISLRIYLPSFFMINFYANVAQIFFSVLSKNFTRIFLILMNCQRISSLFLKSFF